MKLNIIICLIGLTLSPTVIACRSRGVDVTIQNHGDAAVRNVELDYPGAAFGAGSILPGNSFSYRIKPLSTGEIALSFEQESGGAFKQKGPVVFAHQDGQLTLVLEQDEQKRWHMRAEQR